MGQPDYNILVLRAYKIQGLDLCCIATVRYPLWYEKALSLL